MKDRTFNLVLAIALFCCIVFWIGVIFIVIHFLMKWW